ncbi:hypothetical protein PR048_016989 [Dryococelus australis]|uniref:Uncharacterized protein n=1 Tax=Dryococelus australis TaxID=614101 RepID=A0ABQ9H889_9NEOP|nr:hypothetical protein PR048_016989 [Dryococelus australis]
MDSVANKDVVLLIGGVSCVGFVSSVTQGAFPKAKFRAAACVQREYATDSTSILLRKRLLYKQYRLQLVQALTERDKELRRDFCAFVLDQNEVDQGLLTGWQKQNAFFLWSPHNVRIWRQEHLHETTEHERASPKVNVFYKDTVLGPFFFHQPTVTGIPYLDLLTEWSFPQLEEAAGNFFPLPAFDNLKTRITDAIQTVTPDIVVKINNDDQGNVHLNNKLKAQVWRYVRNSSNTIGIYDMELLPIYRFQLTGRMSLSASVEVYAGVPTGRRDVLSVPGSILTSGTWRNVKLTRRLHYGASVTTHRSYKVRVQPRGRNEVSMEQRRNARAREMGDTRVNPPISVIGTIPTSEIQERPRRESNLVRLGERRIV